MAAHVDSLDLRALLERVWVIETVLEVQDCEDSVSCVVVENNWGTWKVLVLDPPKPDVFLAAGDQLLGIDWTELDSKDVEVTDLLGNQLWLSLGLNFADIKDKNGLSFVRIQPDHGQMLLAAQPNLLNLLIGTLEARYTLVIDPYPNR